jgi:arylsulfatase A-like enzyme
MKTFNYLSLLLGGISTNLACQAQNNLKNQHPNIILIMADDMGWGDTGFNGNKEIKTPGLDQMAKDGLVFNRFYAGSAICSPTRGSCITGRNPFRYGIYFANEGMMKKGEITISEVAHIVGYTSGHFGKWHLGTFSKTILDGRRGGTGEYYSPPWENGFDQCFSTEQAVPTWNPMINQPFKNLTRYWTGPGKYATENLEGDDSRVIMDRVIPFINDASKKNTPFLAIVWFHTPHSPVIAGPKYLEMYKKYDENKQHYYGCITAMDEQIARLRQELKRINIDDNTIITFCSDNGPAGEGGGVKQNPGERQQGVTGGFRGRKGVLYEGGLRVPGIIIWPSHIKGGQRTDFPAVTSDYFVTMLGLWGYKLPNRPYDGIDLMPAIDGKIIKRPGFIGFQTPTQMSMVTENYKLISPDRKGYELYDLLQDKYEYNNIAKTHTALVDKMKGELLEWVESCKNSNNGKDYKDEDD